MDPRISHRELLNLVTLFASLPYSVVGACAPTRLWLQEGWHEAPVLLIKVRYGSVRRRAPCPAGPVQVIVKLVHFLLPVPVPHLHAGPTVS